jgi:hypothetical protein
VETNVTHTSPRDADKDGVEGADEDFDHDGTDNEDKTTGRTALTRVPLASRMTPRRMTTATASRMRTITTARAL